MSSRTLRPPGPGRTAVGLAVVAALILGMPSGAASGTTTARAAPAAHSGLAAPAGPAVPAGLAAPADPAAPGLSSPPASERDAGGTARDRTERVLGETPLGRDARAWIGRHGVTVAYRPGGGSHYSTRDNVLYVDTREPVDEAAAIFVHEANHARHRATPDAEETSRRAYVDGSLSEEAQGTVLAIRENQQLQAKRGRGKVPPVLLQNEYEAAYGSAANRRAGERAGTARVKRAFASGEVVQSTDGGLYAGHYGAEWDAAHAHDECFLWVFCR